MAAPVEQLSWLVGEIHDAVLDTSLWSVALGNVARFVGGSSAVLLSKEAATRSAHIHYESGIDPHYLQLYLDQYVKLDPAAAGRCSIQIEQPVTVADLMPHHEFFATQFYREWVQPQGMVDYIAAVLDRSATLAATLVVFRHERDGLADDAARQRMRLVAPHIRRALLVGRLIDIKVAAAATFADTLDGLSAGICMIDPEGRIVHANVAARAILDAGDFLSGAGGRIAARDGKADKILRELIGSAQEGNEAGADRSAAVPLRAPDGTRYVLHVLPLSPAVRGPTESAAAAAALIIRKASVESPSAPDVIARAYRLTPTELRVLLAIVEVGGVPEVATSLGVAESTVKTHLVHLFEKTGACRQADLVKIVAGFSTPLAGQ